MMTVMRVCTATALLLYKGLSRPPCGFSPHPPSSISYSKVANLNCVVLLVTVLHVSHLGLSLVIKKSQDTH